jgi:hypothetical protein
MIVCESKQRAMDASYRLQIMLGLLAELLQFLPWILSYRCWRLCDFTWYQANGLKIWTRYIFCSDAESGDQLRAETHRLL